MRSSVFMGKGPFEKRALVFETDCCVVLQAEKDRFWIIFLISENEERVRICSLFKEEAYGVVLLL